MDRGAQVDNVWPVHKDRAAIDPTTGTLVSRSDFADWPLLAKLSNLGINAHMAVLFGVANQILLAALALGLLCVIFWGYRMWWQRRPTRADGFVVPAGPRRWRTRPAATVRSGARRRSARCDRLVRAAVRVDPGRVRRRRRRVGLRQGTVWEVRAVISDLALRWFVTVLFALAAAECAASSSGDRQWRRVVGQVLHVVMAVAMAVMAWPRGAALPTVAPMGVLPARDRVVCGQLRRVRSSPVTGRGTGITAR